MRIGVGGSNDFNRLFTNTGQFRNQDFVVNLGECFWRQASLNASAGNFSEIQLFNPAGSGVNIIVDDIDVSRSVNGSVFVGTGSVELATVIGAWFNKRQDLAVGAGIFRSEQPVVQIGDDRFNFFLMANFDKRVEFNWPPILTPGQGMHVRSGAPNAFITVTFQGREVTI